MSQMRGRARGVWAAIALLAVALKVMAPPGFMVAPVHAGAPIVICTGHGPVSLEAGQKPAKTRGQSCPFAGNVVAPPPQATPVTLAIPVAYAVQRDRNISPRVLELRLAAPPPPAQAPPIIL
jgi:hypothetical protein